MSISSVRHDPADLWPLPARLTLVGVVPALLWVVMALSLHAV